MSLLYLFHTDEHKIPLYQFLSFCVCLSQPVKHVRWWVSRGCRCRRVQEVGASGVEGRRQWDLAWPVGGLIPVLALELLSSAVAQIFRFGLGCHVGLEIFCSRLLPRSIQGLRGALGWR